MYISLDIGKTNTRLVGSRSVEKPVFENKVIVPTAVEFEAGYRQISDYLGAIGQKIEGIGVGIAGDLDEAKTMVIAHSNPCYVNQPLKQKFTEQFGCRVTMDNDAVVAAVGEAVYGKGDGQDFGYITWGSGIGGAVVKYINSKPRVTQIDWVDDLQTWEEACGGKAVEHKYGKLASELDESEWARVMADWERELKQLATELKINRFICGGGIAVKQQARLLQIGVEITALGEDTGLYGGFGLLFDG